jgi:hypothetical protein|tara:strand:- start:725 stop:1330 length:606 start_codon:yes stop_codon:yes gene_type:complete
MMVQTDVRVLTVSDENAADADRLVTAARPDTSATMANTTFAGGAARNVTVTTAGTGDNAKTCTITGTDVFGDAMTEVITSTSSAEAVAGAKLFLTVSAVECSAQYAANITVGSGSLCAQAVGDGARVRLKGMNIVSGGTAGTISFYDGAPEDGTVLMKSRTIGTANTNIDRTIPSDGILFGSGLSVQYTVDVADMMTFFYT